MKYGRAIFFQTFIFIFSIFRHKLTQLTIFTVSMDSLKPQISSFTVLRSLRKLRKTWIVVFLIFLMCKMQQMRLPAF